MKHKDNRIVVHCGDLDYVYFGPHHPKRASSKAPLMLSVRDGEKGVAFAIYRDELFSNDLMQLLKIIEYKAKRAQEELANLASPSAASSKEKG